MTTPESESTARRPAYSPVRILAAAAAVLLAALLLGIVLPFVVNYAAGTLDSDGVKTHLEPAPKALLQPVDDASKRRHRALDAVEERLLVAATAAAHEPVSELLQLKTQLLKEEKEPRPIVIYGYLNDNMPLWPLFYAGLGWLATLLVPGRIGKPTWPTGKVTIRVPVLFFCILIFYRWPAWYRNSPPLGQIGRKVYAYSNRDVSHSAFWAQEIMAALVCVLLTIVWEQWLRFFEQRSRELDEQVSAPAGSMIIDPRRIERLHDTFLHWQLSSVMLAIAFLYSTFFFWARVAVDSDRRYIADALSTHLLWITTWLIISAPLFITWRDWTR